jgi:electron transport complex protein RnfC
MFPRKSGVKLPHLKSTAAMPPVRLGVPAEVIIPMSMSIGKPAVPTVKPKDHVNVGTLIAESAGPVSAPIHSGVSGTVKKVDTILSSNGSYCQAVVIESDGLQTVDEGIRPPVVTDYASFIEAVRNSGIVGLGGAGFPTAVKLDVKDTSKIEYLILNGAECEPFITSDNRTMLDTPDDIKEGVRLFEKYLDVKKIIIGIEGNKPEAIKKMTEVFADDAGVTVKTLPESYPQGGEKVLIYTTTGRVVPAGKLPLDVGCVVVNVTTIATIARYVKTGMPLVEKCVTVDGTAVKKPQNVIAPIGTPVSELLKFCEADEEAIGKVLYGGPMMGIAIPDPDTAPVLKTTNGITVLNEKDGYKPEATQCIHCGRCALHCPMNLSPLEISRAYENKNVELIRDLRVDICFECGTCSYVCPARRPLVEINKLSKVLVRELNAKEKQKEAEKK